jgi:predicted DNA-binding protein (MmcQ/YjbR family)
MDIESYREYCLNKAYVTESFPFDNETLVFKVGGKVFALANISTFDSVNLKCEPSKAVELREQYDAVIPGYHMNKKHWNTILIDGRISWKQLKEWIDDSYNLVLGSLPKKERDLLLKLKKD